MRRQFFKYDVTCETYTYVYLHDKYQYKMVCRLGVVVRIDSIIKNRSSTQYKRIRYYL